jgi:hypothetical protein
MEWTDEDDAEVTLPDGIKLSIPERTSLTYATIFGLKG